MPDSRTTGLAAPPGLCGRCQFALLNQTRRATVYLRCARGSWDRRMPRYPSLPVLACPGFRSRD